MIQPHELEQFLARVEGHLFGHILPFWCGPAVDHQKGGWMGWLSNDLQPDRSQPKGLILNTRILWAFSAVYRASPHALYQQMANRAYAFVVNKFWDTQHGGAVWRLNDAGEVMDDSKKIYGQAFYIYAMVEFYRAFGDSTARDQAWELFQLVERHAHDAKFGGYIEMCQRDWSDAGEDARLSAKDMNEKKSMNNHLHVLEAYTSLYRIWPEPIVAARLRELVEIFLARILDSRTNHLHHFFDEQWNIRSDSYTYGHDLEAGWLLCETAEVFGDKRLLERVHKFAVDLAESAFDESLGADGALAYEGAKGRIIDPGHECWPHAEALVGFLNAFQISRDRKFLAAMLRVWNFIEAKLVDRVHGEWFWRIHPDGTPDSTLPKVSEWKGPYHASRACLEIIRRLRDPEVKALAIGPGF